MMGNSFRRQFPYMLSNSEIPLGQSSEMHARIRVEGKIHSNLSGSTPVSRKKYVIFSDAIMRCCIFRVGVKYVRNLGDSTL